MDTQGLLLKVLVFEAKLQDRTVAPWLFLAVHLLFSPYSQKTSSTTNFHLRGLTIVIVENARRAKKLHLRETLAYEQTNIALVSDILIIMKFIFLMPHRGFKDTACLDLWLVTFHILEMLYDMPFPTTRQTDRIEKPDRNAKIVTRYEAGETGASLARAFDLSEQRVNQIIRGKRK